MCLSFVSKLVTHTRRKKRLYIGQTRPCNRRDRTIGYALRIRQKYRNTIHHLFMFQKSIQVKTLVYIHLHHCNIIGQVIGLPVRIFFYIFTRTTPVSRKLENKNTRIIIHQCCKICPCSGKFKNPVTIVNTTQYIFHSVCSIILLYFYTFILYL